MKSTNKLNSRATNSRVKRNNLKAIALVNIGFSRRLKNGERKHGKGEGERDKEADDGEIAKEARRGTEAKRRQKGKVEI